MVRNKVNFSKYIFSTILSILFRFPMYVFYWAENFQNGNYWRSFAFLFLSKTKRNNETEPARRLPEDRSSRQTIYFLPFETVKPIHGGHWYLLRHKWTPNSPVVDPDFQLGRGVGGGGGAGWTFRVSFWSKSKGLPGPSGPLSGIHHCILQ